jgi:hypothetical protein
VYWTDNRQHALLRADKETGGQRSVLEEHLEIPLAVAALSIRKNPGTNLNQVESTYSVCMSFPSNSSANEKLTI